MGDIATKRFQVGLEDLFSTGPNSVYQGGAPVAATRRLSVKEDPTYDFKLVFNRTKQARGSYAGMYDSTLEYIEAAGKMGGYISADDHIWISRMLISGAPVWTTLPNTPQALLAATALAGGGNSLTTQPNATADGATAKILQLTLANVSANTTAVTITVTGTDINNNALTEQVVFSAGTTTTSYTGGGGGATSSTLWTKNYFKTVNSNGITSSSQPASDTIAVAGINAFQAYFLSDMQTSTLYSGTAEYWSGSVAWQLPGLLLNKGTWTATMGKEFMFECDAMAQKKIQLGSGALAALTALNDNILAKVPTELARVWADPIGTAPGTTLLSARVVDWKLDLDNVLGLIKAADGTPYANAIGRDYYGDKLTVEATMIVNSTADPAELAQFQAGNSRTMRVAYPGVQMPCGPLNTTGNWPIGLQQNSLGGFYGAMFDCAGKYTEATETKIKGRYGMKFKLESEVDLVSMGAPLAVTVITRINPNYI